MSIFRTVCGSDTQMFYRDCEGVCASIVVFFYFALAILLAVLAVWVAIDLGLFGNCLIESMHRAAFCTIRNSCGASNCLRTTLLILKHLSEFVALLSAGVGRLLQFS